MRQAFLLDTNVISETRKTRPNPGVAELVDDHPGRSFFLSVLTMGELRRGAAACRRSDPLFADRLSLWIDDIEQRFGDRILAVDLQTAQTWGELASDQTRPSIDTLLLATALRHDLTFVTRNTDDVRGTTARLFNPFR